MQIGSSGSLSRPSNPANRRAKIYDLCANDLGAYIAAIAPRFERAHHHDLMTDALEDVALGRCKRLILNLPPRHSKSHLASEFFPAWFLGRNPERFIICATYGQELSTDFGRRVRDQLRDPLFQMIFPGCLISNESDAANRFSTTVRGQYYAVGAGGAITGRGAHLLLIDDPIKNEQEAMSTTFRTSLKSWYRAVAYTRLQSDASIILTQTRWHDDDLVGWLLNPKEQDQVEDWRVLNFPAIAEEDEEWRKKGEPLWPEWFPLDHLEKIRRAVGERVWSSLYQQRPAAMEGMIFKRAWFERRYRFDPRLVAMTRIAPDDPPDPSIPKVIKIIQAWDTAFKTKEQNDRSCCTTWLQSTDGLYLLDCWVDRVEFPELKAMAIALADKWRPHAIYVEDKASGQSLIQELKRLTQMPIFQVQVDRDKVARANSITPIMEAGNVVLPERASWIHDLMAELCSFPKASHDDIVDSVTIALSRMSHWKDLLQLQTETKGHYGSLPIYGR